MRNSSVWIILCWASCIHSTFSFTPLLSSRYKHNPPLKRNPSETKLHLSVTEISSIVMAAEEQSWRQYVPLAVSGFVIVDILLGSPAANSVMGFMRAQEEATDEGETPEGGTRKRRKVVTTGERVDSMAVAQAAIDKANATLELKRFLEDKKTDWDKMEDIRKEMDRQMQELDEKIKEQKEQQK